MAKFTYMSGMTELSDPHRKKLLYRAMHRGFKEADIVIGMFARDHLADMSDSDVAEFEQLLDVPDQELYAWIVGRTAVPANYDGPVMTRLQAYPVADILDRELR